MVYQLYYIIIKSFLLNYALRQFKFDITNKYFVNIFFFNFLAT